MILWGGVFMSVLRHLDNLLFNSPRPYRQIQNVPQFDSGRIENESFRY